MFNEMSGEDGVTRSAYEGVARWIDETGVDALLLKTEEAEAIFRRIGITFAVYGEGATLNG